MSTLKPLTVRDDAEIVLENDFLSKLAKKSVFRLTFTSFRDENKLYHLTYMLERLNDDYAVPAFMRETFTSLDDPMIAEFMNHPLKVLQVQDRAILVFEDRPYDIKEFHDTISDWKTELKNSGLEI